MTRAIPDAQPRDNRRFVCIEGLPFCREYPRAQWKHPASEHVRDDYGSLASGGSYEDRHCPVCGLNFSVQLPD